MQQNPNSFKHCRNSRYGKDDSHLFRYRRIDLNDIVLKKEKEKKQKWFDNEEGLTLRQIILGTLFIVIVIAIKMAYEYYMYCDVWFYFKEPWC